MERKGGGVFRHIFTVAFDMLFNKISAALVLTSPVE